jgi:hypothetical protein
MDIVLTSLIGAIVAIFSTIVGSFAGGATSLIMFPLIMFFVTPVYLDALTADKIATLFMTISASHIHFRKKKINKSLFFILIVFGLIGTAVGTYLVQYKLHEELFKMILAACLTTMALYIFFSKGKGVVKGEERKIGGKELFVAAIFSFLINILNGLFGGTGMFLTLFFVLFLKMTFIDCMVYTMPIYAIINVFQVPYLVYISDILHKNLLLSITMAVCGIIGGIIGTRLQYLKGNVLIKRVAVVVMLVVGIKTFIG